MDTGQAEFKVGDKVIYIGTVKSFYGKPATLIQIVDHKFGYVIMLKENHLLGDKNIHCRKQSIRHLTPLEEML